MKLVIFLLWFILICGALYNLYQLGLKNIKLKKKYIRHKNNPEIEEIIKADTYKIKYGIQELHRNQDFHIEVKIKNRYNDTLTFTLDKENKCVSVKGCKYTRCGLEEGGTKISFIDPSGGPFMSVGMDLIAIDERFKGLIITNIVIEAENKYILKYE